jgi:hypothetical protein
MSVEQTATYIVTWSYSLTREAIRCYAAAGKQQVTSGFRGNKYAHNKRRTAGNSVPYWILPKSIQRHELDNLFSRKHVHV